MKTVGANRMIALLFLMLGWTVANGQQNQTDVPGDNFSLEGALELFKKSTSPEEFERMLNSEDSKVNNLDLNGDGDIDYIKVIDRNEGNVHAFILQAVVSETESQDVAVIELEKLANGKAVLQITGDADIYGMETIIEPTEEVRVNAGTSTARTYVNVWAWPSVQYVYSPYYSVWMSPWRWGVRPVWWSPWRPVAYYVYNPWWQPYRPYYSACYNHRIGYAQQISRPYRCTSMVVYNRHYDQINHYRSSQQNSGYSRGRDADHHNSGGRQSSASDSRNTTDRHRWVDSHGNSGSSGRTSGSDWKQHNNSDRERSSITRSESTSRRSATEFKREPTVSQRNDSRNWSRSSTSTPILRQHETRSLNNNRSFQRSSGQPQRSGSSSMPNLQRSGGGGGNGSHGNGRGRH